MRANALCPASIWTGNDYMHHLRLKSQCCRRRSSPSLLFSYQFFGCDSFAYSYRRTPERHYSHVKCKTVADVRAPASEWQRWIRPSPLTRRPVRSGDGMKIRWNLKHFIYGIFVGCARFTRLFCNNDSSTSADEQKDNYDKCTVDNAHATICLHLFEIRWNDETTRKWKSICHRWIASAPRTSYTHTRTHTDRHRSGRQRCM